MQQANTYEDAIDLLDADHKAVKKMFIDYDALCEEEAPADERRMLAERICQALTIHAQIEEEIFYPKVREAIGNDALMDEALDEHTEAKETIARIQGMDPSSMDYDVTVNALGKLIDVHVLQEREQIFLQARYAALDLRALAVPLFQRKKQLQGATSVAVKETK
jgi:hemerythrin superfamily protein